MRAVIKLAISAAALAMGTLPLAISSSHAQAPNDMVRQYGYQFCNIIGGITGVVRDCMYSTLQQCQAAASGQGYCVENAAWAAARSSTVGSSPKPTRR